MLSFDLYYLEILEILVKFLRLSVHTLTCKEALQYLILNRTNLIELSFVQLSFEGLSFVGLKSNTNAITA